MKTIRQRFYLVAILLGLLFSLNYGLVVYYLDQQEEASQRRKTATIIHQKTSELERELWALRFWEKSILTQNPEATRYFAQTLEKIRADIKPLEVELPSPEIRENVQEFLRLLVRYEEAFSKLIQINTDQRVNRTNLISDYQMITSDILMENEPRLIRLMFNFTRFQDDYFISRKETQYKGLMIVVSSVERRAVGTHVMSDRLRAYFASYRHRLERDRDLERDITVIHDIFDETILKLTANLSNISKIAVLKANQESQIAKELFDEMKIVFLSMAISGILIFLAVIYILSMKIVRPIRELSTVVNRVKAGDMEVRFSSGKKDDISRLGQAFNEMVHSVNEQNAKVRAYQWNLEKNIDALAQSKKELQKHRYHLEELVENRTRDLGISNEHLQQEILERRQAEEALRIAKDEAEVANQAKSIFLANMSHEIRTPLNAILGFLELVLEDPFLLKTQRKHLTTAQSSAHSLLGLINDILDISKLDNGKLAIEQRPFSLPKLLRGIHEAMAIKAREKELNLRLDIHPSVSGSFIGDPLRLRQIIVNLAGNAIKFTEKGGVFMRIMPDEKEGEIHFMIEDTGIGMPTDRLKLIFEPFTQGDSSTTRKYGGTGLGTTISRELVELMGGRIWAESEEGRGSSFHFTVPMVSIGRDTEESDLPIIPEKAAMSGVRRGFRILLVEDVKSNMQLAKIRLERQGHVITEAWNGREAVELFERGGIDLILMDIQMPRMGGFEATRRIHDLERDTGQHVPIIAMTAAVMRKEREEYLEKGMDAVVAKPIDFNKLFETMESLVPKNLGYRVSGGEPADGISSGLELPSLDGVDTTKGIWTWKDSGVYAGALQRFSRDYGNTAGDLTFLIDGGDLESALRLAHTLKGVAGNLSVLEVADAAVNLENALREKRLNDAKGQLAALAAAINRAVDSIGQLESAPDVEETPKQEMDVPYLRELFTEMLAAFDQFSPYAIEPFLFKLKAYLPPNRLSLIENHMERFDFDGAKRETFKLAETLHPLKSSS